MPEFDIEMTRKAAEAITDALRELLEKKHLYQSVIVSRELLDKCKAKIVTDVIIEARSQPLSSFRTRPSNVPEQCDASIQTVLLGGMASSPGRAHYFSTSDTTTSYQR